MPPPLILSLLRFALALRQFAHWYNASARQVTSTSEVQVITAAATASDLDGYFVVGFEGHWSERINHDATADEVASALAGIPAVGDVEVLLH